MRTFWVTLLAFFLCSQLNATHIKGGEITYDYLGNNNYEIFLTVYWDTFPTVLPTMDITTNITSSPNITLNLDTVIYPSNASCNDLFKIAIYKKNVTFINVPTTGIELISNVAFSNSGVTNILTGFGSWDVKTILLPDTSSSSSNSPRFQYPQYFSGKSNSTLNMNFGAFDPDVQDSIYVSFTTGSFGNNPVLWDSSYSESHPFGNTIATHLDHRTGLVSVSNVPIGQYYIALKIQSYNAGIKTSEVNRGSLISIENSSSQNPNILLKNLQFTGQDSSQLGNNYYFEMNYGDSLGFEIVAFNNSQQLVYLNGFGNILNNNSGLDGICTSSNCASFNAINGSFINTGISMALFKFIPDSSFVPVGSNAAFVNFVFEGIVIDSCQSKRCSNISVSVKVNAKKSIWSQGNYLSCNFKPVQAQVYGDTTNLTWSPITGVSNPTSASPILNPTYSTSYTVTNLNNGEIIKVEYVADYVSKPVLSQNNTTIFIPNAKAYDNITWYFNGVIIGANTDSIQTQVSGDYYAYVTRGVCSAYSDTLTFIHNSQLSLNDASNGKPIVAYGNGTYSFEFSVSPYSDELNGVTVLLTEIDTFLNKTNGPVNISVLNSQNQVLATSIATRLNSVFYEANGFTLSLNANEVYILKIEIDSGRISLFKPNFLPYTEPNGIVKINFPKYYDNGVLKTDAFPYSTFIFKSSIGIDVDDTQLDARIYPNPVENYLMCETKTNATLEIFNSKGSLVKSLKINRKTKVNVNNLPSGIYIYKLWNEQGFKSGKMIKQ